VIRKAVTYFIQFAKYQNRIHWGDRSLRKVVKDTIPVRISEELRYSKEDLFTFESLKRVVLKIDSDYWRRISDDKQKQQTIRTLQNCFPKTTRTEQPYPTSTPHSTLPNAIGPSLPQLEPSLPKPLVWMGS